MNLFYVFEHGDAVLVSTFLLLIGMSAVSWYIIFWKAWVVHKEKKRLDAFIAEHTNTPNWPQKILISQYDGVLSILLAEAKRIEPEVKKKPAKRQETLGLHISQALDRVRVWLDKGLTILASIGSSSPFIGLFGTVWGVYVALTDVAAAGNASLAVVAGPMGEALVATALGLFAAIPAVLGYNAFVRSNRVLIQRLRHISEQLTFYMYETGESEENIPVTLATGNKHHGTATVR